jgi:hypothetical protein
MQNSQSTQYIGTVAERKRTRRRCIGRLLRYRDHPEKRCREHSNRVDSAYFPAVTSAIKFGEVSFYGGAGQGV